LIPCGFEKNEVNNRTTTVMNKIKEKIMVKEFCLIIFKVSANFIPLKNNAHENTPREIITVSFEETASPKNKEERKSEYFLFVLK
jgi:hypothetical protein